VLLLLSCLKLPNVRSCYPLSLSISWIYISYSAPLIVVDFEQPRALVTKVMDDAARQRLVENIAGALGGVKTTRIKELQRKFLHIYRFH